MRSKLAIISLPAVIVTILFSTLVLMGWFAQDGLCCCAGLFALPNLQKKISFERKLFISFAVVIILVIVISTFSSYYNNKRSITARLVNHTNEVLSETQQIFSITKDVESGSRGYVITGDSAYLQHFTVSKSLVFDHVKKLKELTNDNMLQQLRIDSLQLYINKRISFSEQTVVLRNEQGVKTAGELVGTRGGMLYMAKIRNLIFDIQEDEKKLLVLRQQENNESIVAFNRAFIILLASVLVLLIIILYSIVANINSRKRSENELKEFKYFFNNSNDLSCIANTEGYFEIVNPSFNTLLGYTEDELSKKPFLVFVHPDDVTATLQVYDELKAGATVIHFTNRYRKKDGSYLLLDWNATPNADTGKLYCIARDVTERKKAEDALGELNTALEQKVKDRTDAFRQSEEQYRHLFQNNPMPMWVISLTDFKFLDVNEMATLQYGYSREEFLAMTALEIRPKEDKDAFLQSDHSYLTDKPNYNKGIWRHRKKDGSIIQVEIIGHEIVFEGAEARLILSHDVTEHKKAEAKLIASELQFRSTLDNMLEGAQIIGFDWRYIYINDSLAKHAKYNRDEMIGYTVMEKFPGIEEADIFKVYKRCFDERVSIHLENEFRFPDDTVGWFELSFQPVPEGIFILSIDITERKKAEAAILSAEANYREIFEKASDAIYVLDIDNGQVIEINRRAAEITGHSKEVLLKRDPGLLVTGNPNYTSAQSQVYMQKAANGEPQQFDWLIKKEDGTHSWIEVNLTKANIAGEERILSFFREINDRKKAQLEVEKLNEELEQKVVTRTEQLKKTNEELEAFSYSVSHDLRAPLRGIIGFTNILEEDYSSKLDDEARRITTIIKNNTAKMGNLIDDLLRFSRLGRQSITKTDVSFNEMVTELIDEMGLKRKNEKISWAIPVLPVVKADPVTIKQVWVNLISNAVKYSGKVDHPQIEIGCSREKKENIFFIKDNGVGFDEKYKEKLFKVFQRLHTTAEFEGTGVGLAIIDKIISKHGGRVWAEAEPGKGACFYFSLPDQ